MSTPSPRIPPLKTSKARPSIDDISPRSEEFREEPSSRFPILISTAVNIANIPNPTVPCQEAKNPLLIKQIDYSRLMKTQEQELIALNSIHTKLESKMLICESELNNLREVPNLIKEKDKIMRSLEISLELAKEEFEMLNRGKQRKVEKKKTTIFASEYYMKNRPKRVWECSESVKKLDEFKFELFGALAKARRKDNNE